MNIILEFGKTEQNFEQQEFDFVNDFFIEKAKSFSGDKYDFSFTDELVQELRETLEKRADEYKKLNEKYKDAKEYPDRYSHYWFYVVYDLADLGVIFNFSHINRRHPFSPDGWALMSSKKVCYVDIRDLRNNYCPHPKKEEVGE